MPSPQTADFLWRAISTFSLKVVQNNITQARPETQAVTVGSRKLQDDERHNLCSSLNIITVIRSRRMKRVGHVTRMGKIHKAGNFMTS
jgi:hypothetical protein